MKLKEEKINSTSRPEAKPVMCEVTHQSTIITGKEDSSVFVYRHFSSWLQRISSRMILNGFSKISLLRSCDNNSIVKEGN